MNRCRICSVTTPREMCHYCTKTVALIKQSRCVTCTGRISRADDQRVEGRCPDCRERAVVPGWSTRRLLVLSAKARYRMRLAA